MRDAIVPLVVLLALGLALRLIIAYVLLPGSGFKVDLGSFAGWAMELAKNGPWGLYDRPIFVDYTPGYLYVLWALGLVSQAFAIPIGDLLKLPAIFADLALALAIFSLAAELGASRRGAIAAAGVFLLVPVTWFDSAVWAQVDSVGTLFLVLAVRELWRGRSERAAVLTTIAAIIKPQFGILIPLAAVVIIRRHWVERPEDGSRLGGGPVRILTTTLVGLVTATLICLPFGITIVGLLQQIVQTAGGYPYLTVNAYNPWALVTMDGAGLASSGTWIRDAPNPENAADPFFTVLGIPAVLVGTTFIGAAIVALMVVLWRRHDDRRALLVALAVMAIAFFVLPTRVHERYLYPFFALGAILLALQPRWAAVYAVLAVANFANLYAILTLPFYDSPGLGPMLDALGSLGRQLGEWFRSTAGVTAAALAHAGGLVAAAFFLARPAPGETDRTLGAGEAADAEAGEAADDDAADDDAAPAAVIETAPPAPLRDAALCRPRPRPWRRPRLTGRAMPCRPSLRRVTHATRPTRRSASPSIGPARSSARAAAVSAASTCGSSSSSSSRRSSCGRSASASPCGCTSTRSTTRGRRSSFSSTGSTASPTGSTSTPIPISRSTRWRWGSSSSATTRSSRRRTSARRSATRPSSRAGTNPGEPVRAR